MNIVTETRTLIETALEGDPTLASLAVAGSTPSTLSVHITRGVPAKSIGGSTYDPAPPFRRETLTVLVIRMQRLRWRRVYATTRMLLPPEEEDLQTLRTKHERAIVPFECWAGWTDLFDALFTWLHEVAPDCEWSPSQIKEKYGTLRFYWHGDLPPLGNEIVEAAEHISGHLCEACGAPGRLQSQHGWWTTRCPEHKHWSPS